MAVARVWNMTPCSSADVNGRFARIFWLRTTWSYETLLTIILITHERNSNLIEYTYQLMFRCQQISNPFIFCPLLTASHYYVGLSGRDLDCRGKHTNPSVMNFALQQAIKSLGGGE